MYTCKCLNKERRIEMTILHRPTQYVSMFVAMHVYKHLGICACDREPMYKSTQYEERVCESMCILYFDMQFGVCRRSSSVVPFSAKCVQFPLVRLSFFILNYCSDTLERCSPVDESLYVICRHEYISLCQ
jgi:hypothetical protein